MNNDIFTVSHGGNVGDLLYAIPAIHYLLKARNHKQARLLLKTDMPATYAKDTYHPCGQMQMSPGFCHSIAALLRTQPCFSEVEIWQGEPVDLDLDVFRQTAFPLDRGDIALYYAMAFQCLPRLWEPWLEVEAEPNDFILINRTQRYHGNLNYGFFDQWQDRIRFVGLEKEWQLFGHHFFKVQWLETENYLDLAKAIKGCRLFIGGQSSAWAIAEALKKPRVLEVSTQAPNVMPHGPDGWMAWSQKIFEDTVRSLLRDH